MRAGSLGMHPRDGRTLRTLACPPVWRPRRGGRGPPRSRRRRMHSCCRCFWWRKRSNWRRRRLVMTGPPAAGGGPPTGGRGRTSRESSLSLCVRERERERKKKRVGLGAARGPSDPRPLSLFPRRHARSSSANRNPPPLNGALPSPGPGGPGAGLPGRGRARQGGCPVGGGGERAADRKNEKSMGERSAEGECVCRAAPGDREALANPPAGPACQGLCTHAKTAARPVLWGA